MATLARRTEIAGEHVVFRESLVTGPVVPGDEWIESRARTLAAAHDDDLLRVRTGLVEQEQMLERVATSDEIVLWFEHDLFCLVHLVYLLQRFADTRVSLIWSQRPLGEEDERELGLHFESRAAATPAMIELARQAWEAYTSRDPLALNALIERDSPDFPFLSVGFALHAARFPSRRNGLGNIEQRALELIAVGATDFTAIFDDLNSAVPKLGFGDNEVFRQLQRLAERPVPLVTITGDRSKASFAITPAGENVMDGRVDDLSINDPDLWLGGAHLTKENLWRWDERARRLTPSRSAVS